MAVCFSTLFSPDDFHRIPHRSGVKHMFDGSQSSMRFVMDTSKFWFCPHINRTEGKNLIQNSALHTFDGSRVFLSIIVGFL